MLWKIYFWILAVVTVVAYPLFVANPSIGFAVVDLCNVLLIIIGLVGVYGYAFKKCVGPKYLWVMVLVLSVVYQTVYSFYLDQQYGAAAPAGTIEGLVTLLPLVPMFLAIFLYIRNVDTYASVELSNAPSDHHK